jgi:hypothetical protein
LQKRDGPLDLLLGGHPGREHEWLARLDDPFKQQEVGQIRRADLVGRNVDGFEEIDALDIPGRTEKRNSISFERV